MHDLFAVANLLFSLPIGLLLLVWYLAHVALYKSRGCHRGRQSHDIQWYRWVTAQSLLLIVNFLHSPPVIYHSHQPVTKTPLCWSVNQASLRDAAVIEADSRMTFSKPVLLSHCTEFAINSEFLTFSCRLAFSPASDRRTPAVLVCKSSKPTWPAMCYCQWGGGTRPSCRSTSAQNRPFIAI